MDEKGKLIEAALFMTPKAVNVNQLMDVIGEANYTMAKGIALRFMRDFNGRDSSLKIVQIEDAFQMIIKPEYEDKVRHLAARAIFHPGIMKTLALIAFKQPISQSLVIKYRNNKASINLPFSSKRKRSCHILHWSFSECMWKNFNRYASRSDNCRGRHCISKN